MAGNAPEVSVEVLPGTEAAAVAWRHLGQLRLTVIAKATFTLVHEGPMERASARPLLTAEVHHGKLPNRSIRYAPDLAPRLPLAEVLLTGHAHAPSGTAQQLTVRLALHRDGRPILDKPLLVHDPAGFSRIPIVYERALGGIGGHDNPLGTDTPTITSPTDPSALAGFGPIGRSWPSRRKLLGATPRKALDEPIVELPPDFQFGYFQTAPFDQQLPDLQGDEWLTLEGLHPSIPIFRTRLPGARAFARVNGLAPFGVPQGTMLPLHLDTVRVDADEQWCSLTFRESLVLPTEEALRAARIVADVQQGADEPTRSLTDLAGLYRTAPPPDLQGALPLPPAKSPPPRARLDTTMELTEGDLEIATVDLELSDDDATLVKGEKAPRRPPTPKAPSLDTNTLVLDPDASPDAPALPFEPRPAPPAEPAPAPRTAPSFGLPEAPPPIPVSHAPLPPPAPLAVTFAGIESEETTAPESSKAALPFDAKAAPALPPPAAAPAPRVPTNTYVLEPEDQESAAEKAVLPFVSRAPLAPAVPPRGAEHVPPRSSDAIPIFTKTPFLACALPWQIRPGQEIRTVVVKGTFDLTGDGPVKLRAEGDPPCGDLHEDDDPTRDLRWASDLAVFKPRADVTLRGHAYPPGGRGAASEVGFRFGRDGKGFDRRIAVFGDRIWSKGLAMTDPAPFERIPLLHERAYGGPDFPKNPLGRGRAPGPDGQVPLPNLEDRRDLLRSPTATPKPVCCAPIPPFFRDRASRLGTYGADWLRTRWPYFPDDFDWAHFQHAPAEQQLDFPKGDETFELVGVFKDTPRIRGRLAGLAPRAYAQKTTAAGGLFFEVVLRLDTVTFDADERKVTLVWRGLLEVEGDEASDIAELYLLSAPLAGPPVDVQRARARYRAERGPWPVIAASPGAPAPANTGQTGTLASPLARSPHEDRIATRLRNAGVSTAAALPPPSPDTLSSSASAPLPSDAPSSLPRDDSALRAVVRERLAKGQSLADLDLAGADLTDVDFTGRSLAFLVLKEARLAGCKLAGADLSGAVLAGADLSFAVLDGAILAGADLTGARLENASLEGADLSVADLSGVTAESASLRKAHGPAARFTGAALSRARLDGAKLPSADFTRATLDGAVLDDLESREVRLYAVRASKASFKRADLTDARADGACLTDCSLQLVKAPSSVWDGAALDRSTFLGAALAGAGFAKASCERVVFSGADLTDARLPRANLEGASLLRANLLRADLESANLTSADLRGANLHGAATWKARLRGAKLDLAITTGTRLPREKT